MAILGANKSILLNQVKNDPNIPLQKLMDLLNHFEDLKPQDFEGYIDAPLYNQLLEADRDPQELELWNKIQVAPKSTSVEIQDLQRLVALYISSFPEGPEIKKVESLQKFLEQELKKKLADEKREREAEKEKAEWFALDKNDYDACRRYKQKHADSAYLSELDDAMWEITKKSISRSNLRRYLSDCSSGSHTDEANQALYEYNDWDEALHYSENSDPDETLLIRVARYRSEHPDSLLINEINRKYNELKEEELKGMKANPSEYKKDYVSLLINTSIFSKYELIDERLMTEDSWNKLLKPKDYLPDIQSFQLEDPNIQAAEGCTDVYLFGTPGTGKTCLLMGLIGANGSGYTINMKKGGGPYAAALQQYVFEGVTPGRTFGSYVTTINGKIAEQTKRSEIIDHNINLVEMSGEEFALHIADNKEASLADMGTGATNLLRNKNRKVFLIIIDPTKVEKKMQYIDEQRDGEGNLIGQRIRWKYVNQLDIMNKFVSLFELPENQDIMSRVDAIHFVVTKADMLGDKATCLEEARKLLLKTYSGPIAQLKSYCRTSRRINYSTNYLPHVFTFSLGRFYLGDIFDFDKRETLQIVDTIRVVTSGTKETSWWNKFMQTIGD